MVISDVMGLSKPPSIHPRDEYYAPRELAATLDERAAEIAAGAQKRRLRADSKAGKADPSSGMGADRRIRGGFVVWDRSSAA